MTCWTICAKTIFELVELYKNTINTNMKQMLKYKNKHKFIDRGFYFIHEGEYKGCFAMNIKECNTDTHKTLMIFPDKETWALTADEIEKLFDKNYFEYIRTLPKKIYKVCVLEFKECQKS